MTFVYNIFYINRLWSFYEKNRCLRSGEFDLIDRVGRLEKPKVVVVPICSGYNGGMYAAYSMEQGRRAGRKSDFTGCLHLDGLIVDEVTPPDSGMVAIMPGVADVDILAAGRNFNEFHIWRSENIHQLLISNGRVWAAFVRNQDGELVIREVFTRPGAEVEHSVDNYEPAEPANNAVFMERLRRALIPWKKFNEPPTLGAFMASYARSYSLAFAADSAQRALRSQYSSALKLGLGITFHATNRETALSRHLIASLLLNLLGNRLTLPACTNLDVEIPADLRLGFDRLPRPENGVVMDPVSIAADLFRKNPHPGHMLNFCEAFWTGLTEDDRACESWNRLPYAVFDSHIHSSICVSIHCASALFAIASKFPVIKDGAINFPFVSKAA